MPQSLQSPSTPVRRSQSPEPSEEIQLLGIWEGLEFADGEGEVQYDSEYSKLGRGQAWLECCDSGWEVTERSGLGAYRSDLNVEVSS